jgi:transposase
MPLLRGYCQGQNGEFQHILITVFLCSTSILVQLPGWGVLSVLSLLAAIGDITRFPSAKKLVSSAG